MLTRRARVRGQEWKAYNLIGLGISVGKNAHEDLDFVATIEMVAAMNKPCLIRLSDTLQRHNLMADGKGVMEAWNEARKNGDEWLERNKGVLDGLPLQTTIVRWDDIINHPDFESVLERFVQLSRDNSLFSNILTNDVEKFLARRTHLSNIERAIRAKCSKDFLLEELAGHTILGRQYNYAGLYPGSYAKIMEMVAGREFAEAPSGMENAALIQFSLDSKLRAVA